MTDAQNQQQHHASELVEQMKASGALDEVFAKIDAGEVELTGDGGLVPALSKETLERGLEFAPIGTGRDVLTSGWGVMNCL